MSCIRDWSHSCYLPHAILPRRAMRALQLDLTPLLLHHLPHDVLVAILQRTSADDLDRVEAVPCRAVSCAARADILWGAAVRRCFGAALAARVAASLEGEPAEGEGEGVPERVPGWLSETVRLSWTMQQAFIASYRAWHAQPTMRTAYRILARLVPPSFASDPQAWVQKLTSGEPREEDKARVLAFFVQMNARRWARARDSAADDVNEHRRVTSVLAHYLTTPKGAEGSSLARATCRAYRIPLTLPALTWLRQYDSSCTRRRCQRRPGACATFFGHLRAHTTSRMAATYVSECVGAPAAFAQ